MPKKRKPPSFDLSLVKMTIPDELSELRDIHRWGFYKHAEECEKLYQETGNPLFVWHIIRMWFANAVGSDGVGPSSIQNGLQLPKWVHDYIKNTACDLLHKSRAEDSQASDVGTILGFVPPSRAAGGISFFQQYHNKLLRHYALSHLCGLLKSEPELSIEDACSKIVDRFHDINVDYLTLKRWYDKSNKSKKVK